MPSIFLFVICFIKATLTLNKIHGIDSHWNPDNNHRHDNIPRKWIDAEVSCIPWSPEYINLFQNHLKRCGLRLPCKNLLYNEDGHDLELVESILNKITSNFPVLYDFAKILNPLLQLPILPTFSVKVAHASDRPDCFNAISKFVETIPSFFIKVFNFTNPFRDRRDLSSQTKRDSSQGGSSGHDILRSEHKNDKNSVLQPTIYEDVQNLLISSTESSILDGLSKSPSETSSITLSTIEAEEISVTSTGIISTKKPNLIKLKKVSEIEELKKQCDDAEATRIAVFDDVTYDEKERKRKRPKVGSRRKSSDSALKNRKSMNKLKSDKADGDLELKILGLAMPKVAAQSRKSSKPKIKSQPNIDLSKLSRPKYKAKVKAKQKEPISGQRSESTSFRNDYEYVDNHKTPIKPYYAFEGPMSVKLNHPQETKIFHSHGQKLNGSKAVDNGEILDDFPEINPNDPQSMLNLAHYLKTKFADNPDFKKNAQRIPVDHDNGSKARRSHVEQPNNMYPYIHVFLNHYGYNTLPLNNGGIFYEQPGPDLEKQILNNVPDEKTDFSENVNEKANLSDNVNDKNRPQRSIRLIDFIQGVKVELNEIKLANYMRKIAREKFNLERVNDQQNVELIWEHLFDEILESLDGTQIRFDGEIMDVRVKDNETTENPKRSRDTQNVHFAKEPYVSRSIQNVPKDAAILSEILKMISKRSMQRTFLLDKSEFRYFRSTPDDKKVHTIPETETSQERTASNEFLNWLNKLELRKNVITFLDDPVSESTTSDNHMRSGAWASRFLRGTNDDNDKDDDRESSRISLHFVFTTTTDAESGKSRIQNLDLHAHVPDDFDPFDGTISSPVDEVQNVDGSSTEKTTNDACNRNESKSTEEQMKPNKDHEHVSENETKKQSAGELDKNIIEYIDYTINKMSKISQSTDLKQKRLMVLTSLMYLFNVTEQKLAEETNDEAELDKRRHEMELNRVDRKVDHPEEFVNRLYNLYNTLSDDPDNIDGMNFEKETQNKIDNGTYFHNKTEPSNTGSLMTQRLTYDDRSDRRSLVVDGSSEESEFVIGMPAIDEKIYDTLEDPTIPDIDDYAPDGPKLFKDYIDEPISNKSLSLISAVRFQHTRQP